MAKYTSPKSNGKGGSSYKVQGDRHHVLETGPKSCQLATGTQPPAATRKFGRAKKIGGFLLFYSLDQSLTISVTVDLRAVIAINSGIGTLLVKHL